MAADGTIDRERLQAALDDIAGTVEWAAGWIEYLETEEARGVGTSDLAILKAQAERLRVVADAVAPERIRDPRTERRLYLAPDDVAQRALELGRELDAADAAVASAEAEVEAERREEDRRTEDRERRAAEREQARIADQQRVAAFLRESGPSTAAQIAAGTGLSKSAAEQAARVVAKSARGRFEIPIPGR